MEKFYKISIPKPCHEDWNRMTVSEKGRFCSSCAKTVIDFTKMSSIQIHDFLDKNQDQKICGHFKKTQLDTIHLSIPIQIIKTKHSFRTSFLLALLIAMGTTLINCTNHDGKQQKIENIEIEEISKPKEDVTISMDSIPKKCNKNASTFPLKKKNKEKHELIQTTGEIITPFEIQEIPTPIETVEGDIDMVIGILPLSRGITNLNNPIPTDLLDTFPALIGTPKDRRTSKNYSKQVKRIVAKHFNTNIGKELGLLGTQRIHVQYEIDKNGIVTDIKTRAPHPNLEKEAQRVIQKIPKLIPGVYKNKPVRTIYSLPILYKIEE